MDPNNKLLKEVHEGGDEPNELTGKNACRDLVGDGVECWVRCVINAFTGLTKFHTRNLTDKLAANPD